MNNKASENLVFSVREAGKLLGLSRGSVYEAIRTGQIPSIRVGRRILIPRAALEQLLEGTTTGIKPHKS
jgi:excisionase family DNA binding protein